MGQIDSGSKSNRLLASRRYTHNTLTAAQESFTNVLDLRSEEIYTRAHLIPSSSLPHSGSSQKMAVYTKNGQNVTKYWYRHKLTKSNTNNEVWFFLNPTGSNDGVGAQLINDNQEVNFISPKYSTAALATSTTADSTPGYLAAVYKSTSTNTSSLDGDDLVSTNDYQFDYKTGVLQFKSSAVDPTDSQYLYMTVYQYVGQTLKTGLEIEGPLTASNVTFTGESDITSFGSTAQSIISGSWKGELSSSLVKVAGGGISGSSTSTGSFARIVGDNGAFVIDNAKVSGSSVSTGSFAHISAISIVSGSSTATGSFGQVFVGDRLVFKDHQDSGEYIESDGTDLSINVGANGDINIPANIGMTFGNDGEKIEGDGTNLTLAGGDINLTAETDINVPANVGLTFGNDGEKIEGDGTDMTIASSGALTLSSGGDTTVETVTFNNGDVTIPGDLTVTGNRIEAQVGSLQVADHTITVGSGSNSSALMQNAGIDWGVSGSVAFLRYRHAGTAISSSAFLEAPKLTVDTITIDAAEIDASGALDIDTGGDITLSATGDVNIPADIGLTFGNDGEKIEGDGTDLTIASSNDLHLTATTDINIPSNVGLTFGNDGEKIEGDGTDLTIASSAKLKLDVATDLEIDVDGGDITVTDDGAHIFDISATKISGSATSTGSFGYIKAQSGISSSGQVDINSSFAQLRLTDDGMNDYLRIGQSGAVGYIKTSDADNNFKFRRGSDNTDLVEIFFQDERTHISGSGGLDVTGHITASGNISASGNIIAANITGSHVTASSIALAGSVSASSLYIEDYLYHTGDPDSYIGFPTGDKFDVKAGGINFIRAWQKDDDIDKLWFNVNEEPMNFRFYTEHNSPGLKISGSGEVGMYGINKPSASIHMGGNLWVESHITASGNVSGSSTTTGSFAYVNVTSKVSGSSVSTGSFGRLEVGGNTNIDGDITIGGNITIGDADSDSLSISADLTSNLIPNADATYDLGSTTKGWNDLHLGSGGVVNFDGGDVTLTHSSNLVTITGGTTRVDKLEIDSANDHIDIDTDMVLTAAADITLTPGGANVKPGSDSAIDLGVSGTAFRELFVDAIDLNGQGSISIGGTGRIDLDADDDTSIRASADDVITFEAGAVDIAQMTTTMAVSGSSVSTGSFGKVLGDGSDLTNVTDDSALAFSIVFGG